MTTAAAPHQADMALRRWGTLPTGSKWLVSQPNTTHKGKPGACAMPGSQAARISSPLSVGGMLGVSVAR